MMACLAAISRLITMRGHPAAESTPGAANVRRTCLFHSYLMLFAVETSSPAQRAHKRAKFFNKWRSSQLDKLGITPPCQRIPISTRANLAAGRLVRIYRGMPIPWLGPDRPLTPTPSRRGATVGRMAQTQTPKATGCQGLHRASLESETTSSNSKCIAGLAMRHLNNSYTPRYRP